MRRALVALLALLALSCGRSGLRVGIDHRLTDQFETIATLDLFRWNELAGWPVFLLAEEERPDVWITEDEPTVPGANGSYSPDTGIVRVRPDLSPRDFEVTTLHELGHVLFGRQHTRTGVMSNESTVVFGKEVEDRCKDSGWCL